MTTEALSIPDLSHRWGISQERVRILAKRLDFPKPLNPGSRYKVYAVSDIEHYEKNRKRESNGRPTDTARRQSPMLIPVELQLIRDGDPRSMPSPGFAPLGEVKPQLTKLRAGPAAEGTENMVVVLENPNRISEYLLSVYVSLLIEGVKFSEARPTVFWLGVTDAPSGVVYFPVMAGHDNRMFRGIHWVLIRTLPR